MGAGAEGGHMDVAADVGVVTGGEDGAGAFDVDGAEGDVAAGDFSDDADEVDGG